METNEQGLFVEETTTDKWNYWGEQLKKSGFFSAEYVDNQIEHYQTMCKIMDDNPDIWPHGSSAYQRLVLQLVISPILNNYQ